MEVLSSATVGGPCMLATIQCGGLLRPNFTSHVCSWLHTFLKSTSGTLKRKFGLASWINLDEAAIITLDAMRGCAVAWFSSHMSKSCSMPSASPAGSKYGTLCALVAPRAWMAQWALQRVKPSNPLRFCSVVVRAADATFPISGKKHRGPRVGFG